MRKFLFLIALFTLLVGANSYATKKYATYGSPAANGSWNSETSTYTWTDGSNNLMSIFTFSNGELKDYNSIIFTTDNLSDGGVYRLYFHGPNKEIAFYSAGAKNIVFAERSELNGVDLSTVTGISFGGASSNGSVQITGKPYISKPMSLIWNDNGEAEIDLTDLIASGGFSLNEQTGELTGTGGSGSLRINFPAGGVDLSALTGFSVTYTGDNLFNNFEIGDGITNKGFWSNVTGRNDLNQYMTVGNVGAPTAITNWKWNNNSTASTMIISSIKLKAGVITASNPHETLLTSSMFIGGCENHFGENVGQGTTIYGNGSVLSDQYVDLSPYDEMRIYGTPNKTIRLLFNWGSANQKEITGEGVKLNSEGYYSLDLSTVAPQQLNAFKFPYDGTSGVITKVILYKESVPVPYSYAVSGSGFLAPSATAALADATATSFDATGLTNTSAIELVSANPNSLFIANSGKLSNTNNVIVSGTCANLELTDGYPFKAPANFTATTASYSTTISAAGAGTLCLPFAAAIPEGVTAYTLNYTAGNAAATATPVETTIPANTPVLLNGSGDKTFTGSGTVSASATNVSGALTGVFQSGYVPVNSYVLQDGSNGIGFYKVEDADFPINPFRAYLTASNAARSIRIVYGGVTGVNEVKVSKVAKKGVYYNLKGQRVSNPTKGLYIVDGVKVNFE